MAKFPLSTLTLLAISAFGVYSILGLTERNGWSPLLRASLEDEPTLPNTGEPLRTHYTGIAALDALLTTLVHFFYSCAVGERPALSVFTVYFAGQVLPSHAVLVLEGLKVGNKGTALYFPAIWGIAYQCVPFGVTLPIYYAVHLWRSPLARITSGAMTRNKMETLSMDPAKLYTVTVAMVLGFVVTTALPTLPASMISSERRQAFLALWQIFPLCVSFSHHVVAFAARTLGLAPKTSQDAVSKIKFSRKVYRQILVLSAAVHLGTIAFVASPQLRHAVLGSSAEPIDFASVFLPMSAFSPHQVEALAEGTQTLLQYDMYCGCAAAFVWAISLSYATAECSVGAAARTAGKLVLRSVLVGPGGAVLWALWDRDEEVLANVEVVKKVS